ncbi:hypothetical protein CRV09_02305 [Candidatus Pantoea edessiphila]|uniref:Inner membrane protein YqjE n=1 Tax=Candidatus Pantoea edessiphila TaxID=2044610 RepID=A0A2P5T1P8_9GAMM|nr:phage holin family protein [Candidatus Pantoea edessiphila]PPI88507.1 hypothetical protein CRV09_02305 [Candidatus Pantoea edessiphila]
MDTIKNKKGPSKTIIDIIQNMIAKIIIIIETRLRLAILEIEEEKTKIIQILLMIGLTVLFITAGFFCLLMVIIFSVSPQFRVLTMLVISFILFLISFLFIFLIFKKSQDSTLLKYTLKELKTDCNILESNN